VRLAGEADDLDLDHPTAPVRRHPARAVSERTAGHGERVRLDAAAELEVDEQLGPGVVGVERADRAE